MQNFEIANLAANIMHYTVSFIDTVTEIGVRHLADDFMFSDELLRLGFK